MQTEHILASAPIFLLAVDDDLRIVCCNDVASRFIAPGDNRNLREVMDAASADAFARLRYAPDNAPAHLLATFIGRNGLPRKIAGVIDRALCPDGSSLLRFTASYAEHHGNWLENLALAEAVLHGFAQTSSEAMWCIEFSEPVDISRSDSEIVRQIFENDCHWLFCNEALTRLYRLPEGLDIERQPVSLYFPRIPENEAFILQIIHSGFSVDNAPSTDLCHDGSVRYMENNVRCSITDDYLFRIFGTLRDVTRFRQAQTRLKNEADTVRDILSALPDAILVIDRDRQLLAVNSSFKTLFGWDTGAFLGRDVQDIIDLAPLPCGRQWCWLDRRRWQTTVRTKFDACLRCEAQIAPIGEEDPHHFVLSLRPLPGLNGSERARP